MMRVYYHPMFVAAGHAFDTTRKARWVAESLAVSPIPGIELHEPAPLTRDQVIDAHAPDYVHAIETGSPSELARSQGFSWDEGLWPMVLASNGGVVAAATTALRRGVAGSLSSGLHHARHARGAGFCTFNGLVIAAREALAAGARSVLILDLDAHCGGGTASMIVDEPRIQQIDVSVDGFDSYPSSEQARLDIVSDGSEYLPTVRQRLAEVERHDFDLCLYNAGMDPCEECATGGLPGITRQVLADREGMVFKWCANRGLPVAFVLAGGYVGPHLDQGGLVELHRLTLSWAAEVGGGTRIRTGG